MAATRRRYPPPWQVEERPESFVVKDGKGQPLAYVYFEDEPQRQMTMHRIGKDDAWQLARAITRIPGLLQRDLAPYELLRVLEGCLMCGRFTVKATWAELVALYRLTMDAPPHNVRPRYNVCPTDPVDVVTAEEGQRELIPMRWGLVPRWWSKPLKELRVATFNARAETVETKPVFRDAFNRTRCLIPMSGNYEWQATAGEKQPWYFTPADGSPLLTAAGLWDEWKDRATGERLKSCTMIITKPNDFVAEVHDRMPVLLTEGQFAPWLNGDSETEMLAPAPNDYLQRWPVSKRVNSSKADADDATLIDRIEPIRAV
jgi:putative SOS response-associated peptidase YedK